MKIYIRSSELAINNLADKYIIDVCYEVDFDMGVYASEKSKIHPVKLPNGERDLQALADYNSFVTNVYGIISEYFDIVEIEESTKSDTSWYFWIYAKNENGEIATKFLIRLRLSDHEYTQRHSTELEKAFVDKKAQELKRPREKKLQKWRIREIIVNDETYHSYDEAEDAIDEELEAYSKKMYNKGN